jgi:hypothetical protein
VLVLRRAGEKHTDASGVMCMAESRCVVLGALSHEQMNVLEERCEMDGCEICD